MMHMQQEIHVRMPLIFDGESPAIYSKMVGGIVIWISHHDRHTGIPMYNPPKYSNATYK